MTGSFRDAAIGASFARDGYVVIDLLGADEIASLAATLARILPADRPFNDPHGQAYVSYFDLALRQQVSDLIQATIGRRLLDLVDGYRILFATTFWKPARGAETPIHQHSPYVSAMRSTTIACWCPLVDCVDGIGAFGIVPRTHRLSHHVQVPSRSAWWQDCLAMLRRDYLETLAVRAGQAVLFDDTMPHGATANDRDGDRMAVLATLVPDASVAAIVDAPADGAAVRAHATGHGFGYSDLLGGRIDARAMPPAIETLDDAVETIDAAECRRRLAARGLYPRGHWRRRAANAATRIKGVLSW